MTLSDFKTYCEDEKKDATSKLIHLLQLETEGQIQLSQPEPFGGDIGIGFYQIPNQYSTLHRRSTQLDSGISPSRFNYAKPISFRN